MSTLRKWLHEKEGSYYLFMGAIFVIFLSLRIIAWKNTVLLEDLDSVGYLEMIKIIFNWDLKGLVDLNPDYTPGYGIFGAFFSLPGWGLEMGARFTSLFFSGLVLLAILNIGKHIAKPWEIAIGLFLLSLCPPLIEHSVAVLSEPTYMGLVYVGLWLFWRQYKNPVLGNAAILGITFGFAFLTRMEGVLYIAIIPCLQGVYTLWERRDLQSFKHLIAWSLIYVLCFGAIAAPQIWRVSEKMGAFAINGRQLWMSILNNSDGKSYQEKIKGLDYSPSELNITYLRTHPEELPPRAPQDYLAHIKHILANFTELHQKRLGMLLGSMCLMAFAFGLLSLFQSGYRFETFLVLAFIASSLLAPLMHNVVIRHILVIAPLMCLVAGIGIVYATKVFAISLEKYSFAQYVFPVLFLLAIMTGWAFPIRNAILPKDHNHEYSPREIKEPLRILKDVAKNQLGRVPVVLAERGYLPYYLGGKRIQLPYASYKSLVKYCELNNADFIYFSHKRLRYRKYPFFKEFTNGHALDNFTLVYTGEDASGEKVELYRFRNGKGETANPLFGEKSAANLGLDVSPIARI